MTTLLSISIETLCVAVAVSIVLSLMIGACWFMYPRRYRASPSSVPMEGEFTSNEERRYRRAEGHE